jgi:hypothetical protein
LSVVLSLGLAAVLVVWLFVRAGPRPSKVAELLAQPGPAALLLIILASAAHMGFGALKWYLVMRRTESSAAERVGLVGCFYTTCLGALLSQLLPVHVATTLVRGLSTRTRTESSWRGATSSLYEQAFDVVMLPAFAVPSVLALVYSMSFATWIGIALISFGFSIAGVVGLLRFAATTPRRLGWRPVESLMRMAREASERGLFEKRFAVLLIGLSLARYLSMLTRSLVFVSAIGLPVPSFQIVLAFTIVQAACLFTGDSSTKAWLFSSFQPFFC